MPVQVSDKDLSEIFDLIEQNPKSAFEVNLDAQTLTLLSTGRAIRFGINPHKKECMINGYDDIDYLLNLKTEIEQFESTSGV